LSKERAPGTGYDLNTEFEGGAKYFWSVEDGEIYRALQTMQKEGWLACAPEDLAATIFHCLGIGPDREFHDSSGRPYRIYRGQPIHALL
jgi:hypothetical protein